MSQFFINPLLFTAGLIAIAAPIIIHLLNRRRFKKVDWAAMDFLLEAQRLNKRRVKLEELILLILRCLALILIGLFLARPSLNVDLKGVLKAEQTERVIVLDDSLSMGSGGKEDVPIERLSNVLEKGINAILNNNDQDLITIVRTTDPNRFNPNAVALNEDSISNLLNGFKEIKASDQRGDLISALNHVNDSFDSKEVNFNKVVYLMTDLRLTDWESINITDTGQGVPDLIKKISEKSAGFYIVDLGSGNERNLSIESVNPLDKALVNEVPSDFEVNVRNYSNSTVSDIEVNFSAKGSLPLKKTISNIDPGEKYQVVFFSNVEGRELSSAEFDLTVDYFDGIPANMNNKSFWLGPKVELGPFDFRPMIFLNFFGLTFFFLLYPASFYWEKVEKRKNEIEEKFPDFLRDMAEYWKGGLSMTVAVQTLVKSEYGALNDEVKKMSDQLSWGIKFSDVIIFYKT